MEIKTMTNVDHDLAKGWVEGGGNGTRVYQGWVESERLHYNAIVKSPCSNTVLMMCL